MRSVSAQNARRFLERDKKLKCGRNRVPASLKFPALCANSLLAPPQID